MTAQPRTIAEAASMLPAPTMRVYRAIRAAAAQGAVAPTTEALADIAATKSATGHLARLIKAGMIRIERRSGMSRSRKRFLDVRADRWTGWLVLRDRGAAPTPARPLSPHATTLLAILRAAAVDGAPLPPTREIADALGIPADDVCNPMRSLKIRALVKIEASAKRIRRAWVADVDRWTGWSAVERVVPPEPQEPPPPPPVVKRPLLVGGYRGRRYEDDPHFATLGRTGRPIIGRPGSGFIPREASC